LYLLCSFRIAVIAIMRERAFSSSLHDQLSLHVFLDGCSLGHSAQQENILELFERPVQEEYEEKSKACDAAATNSKEEVAAVVKEMKSDDRQITPSSKSALQQQLKVSCVRTHFVHNCLLQCCRDCFKWRCLQPLGFKLPAHLRQRSDMHALLVACLGS